MEGSALKEMTELEKQPKPSKEFLEELQKLMPEDQYYHQLVLANDEVKKLKKKFVSGKVEFSEYDAALLKYANIKVARREQESKIHEIGVKEGLTHDFVSKCLKEKNDLDSEKKVIARNPRVVDITRYLIETSSTENIYIEFLFQLVHNSKIYKHYSTMGVSRITRLILTIDDYIGFIKDEDAYERKNNVWRKLEENIKNDRPVTGRIKNGKYYY